MQQMVSFAEDSSGKSRVGASKAFSNAMGDVCESAENTTSLCQKGVLPTAGQ
ncbi:MAG: hypothetical protein ACYSW4_05940 [Planctomycetota bacterium]